MKTGGAWIVCGLLLLAAPQTQADEVDDLLAGKPVNVKVEFAPLAGDFSQAEIPQAEIPVVEHHLVAPLPTTSPDESHWDAALAPRSSHKFGADAHAAHHDRKLPTPTAVSLVPEPSAILLAAGAILYFLIFFRRRNLA